LNNAYTNNRNVWCTLQKLFLGQCWFDVFQVMHVLFVDWSQGGPVHEHDNVLFYCKKVPLPIWVHGSFVRRFRGDQWVVSIAAL